MLNLANWFRARAPVGRKAAKLYGSIVTQSRNPVFYQELGIPDTPTGRYEVLVLHMAVVLHRLNSVEAADGPISRAITEAFVTDIDDSLREMAFGDMSVPRRVKKAAAGLRERCLSYRDAFEADNSDVLKEMVAGLLPDLSSSNTEILVTYAASAAALHSEPSGKGGLADGIVTFPAIDPGRTFAGNEVAQ